MSKDAYYLKHDSNASADPKMEAMILRYGMEGYGRFWRMAEILRDQTDHRLPRRKWGLTALARAWGCDETNADAFLEALISTFELIKCQDDLIWSERVIRDMKVLEDKRESAKRSAEARWGKSERNANASKGDANAQRALFSGTAEAQENDANAMLFKQSRAEQTRTEQSSSNEISKSNDTAATAAPPAAASMSSTLLKNRLSAAGIQLVPADLDACASKLIAASADESFIVWALRECTKAKKPEARPSWFVKGLQEWHWIEKWRANGKTGPQPAKPQIPPAYEPKGGSEREAEIAAGRKKLEMRMPLTEFQAALLRQADGKDLTPRDRELLGLPVPTSASAAPASPAAPAPVQRTFDEQTGEKIEKPSSPLFEPEDDFEDDIPWPAEDEKKAAEPAEKELELF
jgi:hypothetical protein